MKKDILVIITIIITLSAVFFVISIQRQIEKQNQAYQKTQHFVEKCIEDNGIYSEARTSRSEKTMICSKREKN